MFEGFQKAGLAIFGAIIGLAILSVIVSKNSQTSQVVSAFSGALSKVVSAAVSPIAATYGSGNGSLNSFSTPSFPTPNLSGLFDNQNRNNPTPSWIIGG